MPGICPGISLIVERAGSRNSRPDERWRPGARPRWGLRRRVSNAYPRAGEPDKYLVTITESVVSGAEGRKRTEEYRAWKKKSIAQMQEESGNRAEYREVMSNSLLQEMTFTK